MKSLKTALIEIPTEIDSDFSLLTLVPLLNSFVGKEIVAIDMSFIFSFITTFPYFPIGSVFAFSVKPEDKMLDTSHLSFSLRFLQYL